MKVLVTGGAGYIGTELIGLLVADQRVKEVIIYDNLSRSNHNLFLGTKPANPAKLTFVKGELLDSRGLRKVLKGVDIVYHLAAKVTTPFANDDAHSYEQVNHWGTAELVYAVEESDVKKFIYTSSTGVYGSSHEEVDEQTEPAPKTPYAISKLRGEDHVRRLVGSGRDTYIFRCGNVYGYSKSMRFDAVINKFVFESNFYKRITIQGDGKQSRAFIHIDQVAGALANLPFSTLASGTYNLVDRNVRVFDIVDVMKQLVPPLEFIYINQHMHLHELNVKRNELVNRTLNIERNRELKDDLEEFLGRFAF
jgi:UDP-glucose 4-epimerase